MSLFSRLRNVVDTALGEGVSNEADPEDLFDISTAHLTLEAEGYGSNSQAALCFNTVDSAEFDSLVEEIRDLLEVSEDETGTTHETVEDSYGYTWITVEDDDFEDLVTAVHMATDTIVERGYSEHLLCGVFGFTGRDGEDIYWIYSFNTGSWYPFAPEDERSKERDSAAEFSVTTVVEDEMDIEDDETEWYPVWGVPF
ncbi:hypothetical protein ACEU6E_08225 [Halorutilales archaeon Cl-col2-1]